MGKVFSISSTSNYAADTLSLGLISLIIPLLSLSNIFISGGAIISMLSLAGLKFVKKSCKHNRILINAIKVGIEMKYKISLSYNLAIIIGSLIILCILISRGHDIYVILIPILTILASLINLFCDIKSINDSILMQLCIRTRLYFSQTIAC